MCVWGADKDTPLVMEVEEMLLGGVSGIACRMPTATLPPHVRFHHLLSSGPFQNTGPMYVLSISISQTCLDGCFPRCEPTAGS